MGLDALVNLLIVLVVIGVFAWVIHWVISSYLPEPMRTPALVICGAIFLIILLVLLMRWAHVAGFRTSG